MIEWARLNTKILAFSAAAFATGFTVGYIFTRRNLAGKYENILQEEIADVKRHYAMRQQNGDFNVEKIVEREVPVLKQTDPPTQEERVNLFDVARMRDIIVSNGREEETFDYSKAEEEREFEDIYVITYDEFFDGESTNSQTTLTYYVEDDILADEQDESIDDPINLIGEDCLQWGYGSKDNNVVYIRNENLGADYEVLRNQNSYSETVLGFKPPKTKKRLDKFRSSDE